MQHNLFAAHTFTALDSAGFSPVEYSKLKFGSDVIARKYGHELADRFFLAHGAELIANPVVVIPSPYNHVENAAATMTKHFVNRLNHQLVTVAGQHVETSIVHRKVSYTNDYGFLSADQRKSLIDNDSFYLNKQFLQGKTLIFIDDVRITGTHENKLVEILERDMLPNKTFFLYYANYQKGAKGCDIEAALNFSSVLNVNDYVNLSEEPGHHLIVRPMKYLLKLSKPDFNYFLLNTPRHVLMQFYEGCLGEGYYRLPEFQENFNALAALAFSSYPG